MRIAGPDRRSTSDYVITIGQMIMVNHVDCVYLNWGMRAVQFMFVSVNYF